MALEAPLHGERLDHADDLHLIDLAVTRHAANTGAQVRAVIEKRVIGNLVDADQATDSSVSQLSRTGASFSDSVRTTEWQPMQV